MILLFVALAHAEDVDQALTGSVTAFLQPRIDLVRAGGSISVKDVDWRFSNLLSAANGGPSKVAKDTTVYNEQLGHLIDACTAEVGPGGVALTIAPPFDDTPPALGAKIDAAIAGLQAGVEVIYTCAEDRYEVQCPDYGPDEDVEPDCPEVPAVTWVPWVGFTLIPHGSSYRFRSWRDFTAEDNSQTR